MITCQNPALREANVEDVEDKHIFSTRNIFIHVQICQPQEASYLIIIYRLKSWVPESKFPQYREKFLSGFNQTRRLKKAPSKIVSNWKRRIRKQQWPNPVCMTLLNSLRLRFNLTIRSFQHLNFAHVYEYQIPYFSLYLSN